jgi:hypothetical protein
MPIPDPNASLHFAEAGRTHPDSVAGGDPASPKKPRGIVRSREVDVEPLLTADDVAKRLNVSTDWVWDHSSRKKPLLPVIRMGDGTLRYRGSNIEAFIDEQERRTTLRRHAS